MNSKQAFSGEYLKQLFRDGQLTDDLQTHENLKILLNYELDNLGDTPDSNFNFDIIDFCIEKLKEMESMDEQKLDYLGQKLSFEAMEIERKENTRRNIKTAAKLTVVGLLVGAIVFTGQESLAGRFDFVHRLFSQDKGEQLSLETPNLTLKQVEMKEGHLPETLPEGYDFSKSSIDDSPISTDYSYTFIDSQKNRIKIFIKEYPDYKTVLKHELEIDKNSVRKETRDDTLYYYRSNKNINSISWINEYSVFSIIGEISFNKLEKLASLY